MLSIQRRTVQEGQTDGLSDATQSELTQISAKVMQASANNSSNMTLKYQKYQTKMIPLTFKACVGHVLAMLGFSSDAF